MLPFVAELATGGSTVELPVDLDTVAVHAAVPGFCLLPQSFEAGDASTTETLPREDPDFDLRLIKPTSVSGRVMDGEAIPDLCGHFRAEDIRERLTPVDVEVVHYQVDRFRFRVRHRQGDGNLSELKPRTIWCYESEMPARLRFHGAENVGRSAPFILAVPPRFPSRLSRGGRTHIRMQRDRLLTPV